MQFHHFYSVRQNSYGLFYWQGVPSWSVGTPCSSFMAHHVVFHSILHFHAVSWGCYHWSWSIIGLSLYCFDHLHDLFGYLGAKLWLFSYSCLLFSRLSSSQNLDPFRLSVFLPCLFKLSRWQVHLVILYCFWWFYFIETSPQVLTIVVFGLVGNSH